VLHGRCIRQVSRPVGPPSGRTKTSENKIFGPIAFTQSTRRGGARHHRARTVGVQQQLQLGLVVQFGGDVLERGGHGVQRGGHGVQRSSHQRGSVKLSDGVIESGGEFV
jgi:hypothetical protein